MFNSQCWFILRVFSTSVLSWICSNSCSGLCLILSNYEVLARSLHSCALCFFLRCEQNHLDFPTVLWLEDYLTKYTKTLIVVSHDRKFLDNVCTDVMYERRGEKHIHEDAQILFLSGTLARWHACRVKSLFLCFDCRCIFCALSNTSQSPLVCYLLSVSCLFCVSIHFRAVCRILD
jgi:hypothetical protein